MQTKEGLQDTITKEAVAIMAKQLSPDMLEWLGGGKTWENLKDECLDDFLLAINLNLVPSSAFKYLTEGNLWTRMTIAQSTNADAQVLTQLSKDFEWVRKWVADNINTPTEVLKALAKDESASVRYFAAGNPSLPRSSLEILAKDPDIKVAAAANLKRQYNDFQRKR